MQIFLCIITSFVVSLMMIPVLIRIAHERNIFDVPGERKLHTERTPLLGGIAIFSGTLLSFLFWSNTFFESQHLFVLVSLLILFVTGFIDDLSPLRPKVKLFFQIAACSVTVLFAGNGVHGLHGLFGLHSIPANSSVFVSVLFMLLIVNAFNFIDGIDGLAAAVGILASVFFGALFLSLHNGLFAVLSFSMAGALAAFIIFNFSPAKIFMGDTGTLITGFILSLLSMQLTEETRSVTSTYAWLNYQSAPVIVLALLIVPIVDFIRVTFVRVVKGQSPVKGDKNHIHHALVRMGLNHSQTTGILVIVSLIFVSLSALLQTIDQSVAFIVLIGLGICLSQIPYLLQRRTTNIVK